MARNRLEDLGRIHQMIDNILSEEEDVFTFYGLCERAKYFDEMWNQLSKEEQEEKAEKVFRGLSCLKDQLNKIYEITSGQDYLNREEP